MPYFILALVTLGVAYLLDTWVGEHALAIMTPRGETTNGAQPSSVGERMEMEKVSIEDGLYQALAGSLRKLDVEDDGLKKIRISPEAFEAVRAIQKQMRSRLGGRKPDLALVAEAMLMHAATVEGIEEQVRQYAISVFSGER